MFGFSLYISCFPFAGTPSSPRNAQKSFVNVTTVIITWTPPKDPGGRSDIYYEIECSRECSKCSANCSDVKNHFRNKRETQLAVIGLQPLANYTILIYARNGVSEVANKTNNPLSVTIFSGK